MRDFTQGFMGGLNDSTMKDDVTLVYAMGDLTGWLALVAGISVCAMGVVGGVFLLLLYAGGAL